MTTRWRIVGVAGRDTEQLAQALGAPVGIDGEIGVDSDDQAVLLAIEKAAWRNGILLERIESDDD